METETLACLRRAWLSGMGGVWSVLVKTTLRRLSCPHFSEEKPRPQMEKCFLKVPPQCGDKPSLPLYSFPSLPMFSFVCFLLSHICVLPQVTGDSVVCDHRPCGSTNLSSVPSAITSRLCHPTGISECSGAFKPPWETALMQQPA